MRAGDTLVVWKLDRLARFLNQLIETVEGLEGRGIGFRSLTEAIDTTTAAWCSISSGRWPNSNVASSGGVPGPASMQLDHRDAGGRPRKLQKADLKAARAMLADVDTTVEDIAKRLGVSLATLCRHMPAARWSIAAIGSAAQFVAQAQASAKYFVGKAGTSVESFIADRGKESGG